MSVLFTQPGAPGAFTAPTPAPVAPVAPTFEHPPTGEQANILDAARPGDDLVIEAGAGTGKTSTLKMVAAATGRRGLYLAYNRAIADDARASFPATVSCRTAHSLAFRAVGHQFQHRLNGPRVPARDVARILGIPAVLDLGAHALTSVKVARLVMDSVNRFCYSANAEPAWWHIPAVPGLDVDPAVMVELRAQVLPFVQRAWEDLASPAGRLRFIHDHYLKIWALTNPTLPADLVFLDEAQDCQPPGTAVLTPDGLAKIEDLRAGDKVISYTTSSLRLRMKGSTISSISSHHHEGELVKVTTASGLQTRYTPSHICLAKIGPAFEGKTLLYLMRRGQSWRVGITSAYHGKNRPSSGVAGRLREEQADAIWVLAAYKDRRDALMQEAAVSALYGVPELRFQDNGQRSIGQDRLDAFWQGMGDLEEKGRAVLNVFGRDIRYPLAKRSFTDAGDRNGYLMYTRAATIRACNLMDGMEVLESRPLLTRPSQVARRNDDAWASIAVEREWYAGAVWSIEVEDDHTYVGDGIVTHNCNPVIAQVVEDQAAQRILVGDQSQAIYGWRGAVDAMNDFDGQRLALTQSFRFGQRIADEANEWLDMLGAPLRLTGNPALDSRLERIPAPHAVLCRTNAGAIGQAMAALAAGHRPALVGGGDDIRRLAEACRDLRAGRGTMHPELMAFTSWGEVQEYAEHDAGGADLKTLVSLVDSHGPDAIIRVVDQLVDESAADVVISTAHRAKGREWSTVRLAADFPPPYDKDGQLIPAEAMLSYVAVTRARQALDCYALPTHGGEETAAPAVQPLLDVLTPDPEPVATDLPADMVGWLNLAKEARENKARWAEVEAAAVEKLKDWISARGLDEATVGGRPAITYRPSKPGMQLDAKALERDHPDIYAAYVKPKKAARPFNLTGEWK